MKIKVKDSFADYLSKKDHISSSDIKLLCDSAWHWKKDQEKKEQEDEEQKEHFVIGSALHCLVLEPSEYEKRYKLFNREEVLPYPEKNYQTVANREARDKYLAEQSALGITVLQGEAWDKVHAMADSILENTKITKLLPNTVTEESFYMDDSEFGVKVRFRPDCYSASSPYYVSLKTTKASTPKQFAREANELMYREKEAFYFDYLNKFFEGEREIRQALMLVVQNKYPYTAHIFHIKPEDLNYGRYKYRIALESLKKARETGVYEDFKAFSKNELGIIELDFPEYSYSYLNQIQ